MILSMLILGIGGLTWAAGVTSDPVSGTAYAGNTVQIPLTLHSATPVAGLNGEFQYDPALFSNPTIQAGPGAAGFTALGNLVTPGHYKFVIYSDPTKNMNLGQLVAQFQVTVAKNVGKSAVATVTYPGSAASDASAKSLSATLGTVQIKLASSGATDWAFYE
jgi:hypothetical protein